MTPDPKMDLTVRRAIEAAGDRISDFHLWRLGPGHLGAILCVETSEPRGPGYYHELVKRVGGLSHLTVEVNQPQAFGRAISPT